jgi:hypothetical protein
MKYTSMLLPALTAALLIPHALSAQTIIPLVTNTNPSEVTGGGNDFMSQIFTGQTLYIGIPYTGGAWPSAEATDYFQVSTFLLAEAGTSTASFNFFTGNDSGTSLTGITPLPGVSAGTTSVAALVSDTPSDPGNTSIALITLQLDYNNQPGDPFSATTGGVLWLGITNTGTKTINYYTGSPFGVPAPSYLFNAPFDTGAAQLHDDTYTYNANSTLGAANQNVLPYLSVSAVTVPEPGTLLLAGVAGASLLVRRRRS